MEIKYFYYVYIAVYHFLLNTTHKNRQIKFQVLNKCKIILLNLVCRLNIVIYLNLSWSRVSRLVTVMRGHVRITWGCSLLGSPLGHAHGHLEILFWCFRCLLRTWSVGRSASQGQGSRRGRGFLWNLLRLRSRGPLQVSPGTGTLGGGAKEITWGHVI